MRRRRPDDWADERDPAARDAGIEELPAGATLPPRRDRLVITYAGLSHARDRAWRPGDPRLRRIVQPEQGTIVEDRLDGRKVYPAPPHRTREVDRRRRALQRLSPACLPFGVIAIVHGLLAVTQVPASGDGVLLSAALLVIRFAYLVAIGLVPVGVLAWKRDAWRTAPLLFYGAVAWTTLPAVSDLTWWTLTRFSGGAGGQTVAALLVGAVVAPAALGPLAVAFGLERFRRAPDPWLASLARQGAPFVLMAAIFNGGQWLLPHIPGTSISGSGTYIASVQGSADPSAVPFQIAVGLIGAMAPISVWGLAMLAVSTLSAAYFGEPQPRLWQLLAPGALLVGVGTLVEASTDRLIGAMGWITGAAPGAGTFTLLATATSLAGALFLLAALVSPVWSSVPDAADSSLGAPEEVFAWGTDVRPAWARPTPMTGVVSVAAGADHALAADRSGRVAAWGDNSLGQADVPAGLSGVVAVAAGDGFSLALKADGHVVGWGAHDRGQTNIPWGLSGVKAIAAGGAFGLALRGDGTVVGWGDDADGRLEVPDLRGVTAISAGRRHALALLADGTVAAWGDDSLGQIAVPGGLGSARAIAAGGDFSLALLTNGTVAAWGDGQYGQLDVPEGLTNVVAVAAGAFHALALSVGGDVVGWGGGGLAHGESDHPWRLVDFQAIAAGDGFSLGLRAA